MPRAASSRLVRGACRQWFAIALVVAVGLFIAGCGAAGAPTADAEVGSLSIRSHGDGDVVRKERIKIRGSAPPGAEVVRDNSFAPDDHTTANAGGHWMMTVELDDGENDLTFRIGDADETAVTIEITYRAGRAAGSGSGSGGQAQTTPEPAPALGRAPQGPTQIATVASVTDGDTIRVFIDGSEERVRYIGIDAPEVGSGAERMGAEATTANADLVAGAVVVLERDVSKRDQYGRLLRYVWLETDDGWLLVNRELVRRGFAIAISYPPDVKYDALLFRAQGNASDATRGLWAPPPPTPAPTPLTLVPQAPAGNCEPSYPDVCIPIGSADIDCGEIAARRFTVLFSVANPDPHGFDGDRDGIGCESDAARVSRWGDSGHDLGGRDAPVAVGGDLQKECAVTDQNFALVSTDFIHKELLTEVPAIGDDREVALTVVRDVGGEKSRYRWIDLDDVVARPGQLPLAVPCTCFCDWLDGDRPRSIGGHLERDRVLAALFVEQDRTGVVPDRVDEEIVLFARVRDRGDREVCAAGVSRRGDRRSVLGDIKPRYGISSSRAARSWRTLASVRKSWSARLKGWLPVLPPGWTRRSWPLSVKAPSSHRPAQSRRHRAPAGRQLR